mmetsp:Transcript_28076/g.45180  ORF Transcript_28076/g.45180 Transcript_28076/m.45180 type:complete len:354 (-) Transcript_28076:1506-2567(-)
MISSILRVSSADRSCKRAASFFSTTAKTARAFASVMASIPTTSPSSIARRISNAIFRRRASDNCSWPNARRGKLNSSASRPTETPSLIADFKSLIDRLDKAFSNCARAALGNSSARTALAFSNSWTPRPASSASCMAERNFAISWQRSAIRSKRLASTLRSSSAKHFCALGIMSALPSCVMCNPAASALPIHRRSLSISRLTMAAERFSYASFLRSSSFNVFLQSLRTLLPGRTISDARIAFRISTMLSFAIASLSAAVQSRFCSSFAKSDFACSNVGSASSKMTPLASAIATFKCSMLFLFTASASTFLAKMCRCVNNARCAGLISSSVKPTSSPSDIAASKSAMLRLSIAC